MTSRCCISKGELNRKYSERLLSVRSLSSVEDVATLLESFEGALEETRSCFIVDVVEDEERHYIFVTDMSASLDEAFDLYAYINNKYKGSAVVNCVNAKYLFPRGKSRGIFPGFDYLDMLRKEEEEYDDEDTPTGFIDGGIDGVDKPKDEDFKYLVFPKTGDRLKIDYMGVVIGRSSKTASYVIRGNDLVSRPHCKVYKENGKYYVHDCTSRNGTFVDGVQVMPDKDVEIKSGSTLLVANERFVFDK